MDTTDPQGFVTTDGGSYKAVEVAHGRVVDERVGNHDCDGVAGDERRVCAGEQVSKWALCNRIPRGTSRTSAWNDWA
jgi:hypothetical protein